MTDEGFLLLPTAYFLTYKYGRSALAACSGDC